MGPTLVNQALDELMSSYGWKEDRESLVENKYGPDVLTMAKDIYATAINYPVNWDIAKLDEALIDAVKTEVETKYPFLNEQVVWCLGNHFAYLWK
ncbi:MAG: hypothetical protein ACRYFR_20235 [Janthinobacterium lividum]